MIVQQQATSETLVGIRMPSNLIYVTNASVQTEGCLQCYQD